MDRQIINFSANEQSLIKTSGTDHYAGNVVRYIEAHFDLGANWTGYDSVRAIWRNKRDATKVSTVLNSEGVCVVPYEVLTLRGDVCMNLVGSIAEDDVLVDRLTTYPICALTVDVPAMVDGSDPASITPSEYEQFVASVRNDANRAEAGATASEASASEASASAEQATLSAQASEASALRSASSAQNAQTSERNASEYAQNASESATSAENAKEDAENARDKIFSMRATAETLAEGSQATASYSDGVLTLGIPKGDTGERGEKGETGETGATPNLSIGTVETLEPTESATATITGTAEEPILNLGIPQGKTGEVSYEDLSSLLPKDTASGDIISIPDGQSIIPVESLKVTLEPVQDFNGYDKPWSGGAGKNLFDKEYLSNFSNYTLTIGSYKYTDKIQLKPNTNYIITATDKTTLSSALYYVLYHVDGSDPDKTTPSQSEFLYPIYDGRVSQNDNYTKFTTGETGVIRFGVANATALAEIMSTDWQLEEGNTATSWTPYENIAPISGWTDVDTYRTGKNVWGGTQLRDDILAKVPNAVADDTNKTIRYDASAISGKVLFDKFKPNAQYTIILKGYNTNTSSQAENVSIRYTDGTIQYPQGFVNGVSRTVSDASKSIECIKGQWATSVTYLYYDECGVFEGVLTADDFEPYQGTTYTTDLGRTVYGGTLDVVSGELVIDRAMVDLGSLNWTYRSANQFLYASVSGKKTYQSATDYPTLITSIYPFEGNIGIGADTSVDKAIWNRSAQGSTDIIVKDTTYSDATTFKTAMSGHQLVYPLATPQTIQLTPQQVMLLTGDNNVWSDGQVTMVYSADVARWVEKRLS